jgi:hypothetical protein
MEYTSLEQRMVSAYLATFPEFVPDEGAEISIGAQREFYDLMNGLYRLLFDDPGLIVPKLHGDDAFPGRYKKAYGKPDLQSDVLKIERAVKDLLNNLFLLGRGEAVKLSKRHAKILSLLGIDDIAQLPEAWVWMANRAGADEVAFAYCLFDKEHVYTPDIYARLLGEEQFHRLESWMTERGYKPYDIYNTQWVDYRLTLSYANPAWGDERPRGGNEYKIKHTGISAQYDAYVRTPASLGLCIPYGMKPFLERFDSMDPGLKEFVIGRTKKCDGCRYCVQTDKSGKRPLARISVSDGNAEYKLCPYYPGYSYTWTAVDESAVNDIIRMLDFMDGFCGEITGRA